MGWIIGCATIPEPKVHKYTFPKNAFVGDVQRPYTALGPVRSKVDYQTLDPNHEEKDLCRNYYNKAVRDLVKFAKKQGADAVVDVKSVVFLIDGRSELYSTPECSDEGGDGQVLTQGIAVKWKGAAAESGAWGGPAQARAAATGPATGAGTADPGAGVVKPAASVEAPGPRAQPAQAPLTGLRPGERLVPEQDEVVTGVAPDAWGAPAAQAAVAAKPEAPEPVTAQLEDYASQRGPAPAPPAQYTAQPPAAPIAASPVTARPPASELPEPTLPAARPRPGDPRLVPGMFQRAP